MGKGMGNQSPVVAPHLQRRREKIAAEWNLTDECVVVNAGLPVSIPGSSHHSYPFRAHPDYFYLTGRNRRGSVLGFDPRAGWVDFPTPVKEAEQVAEGLEEGPATTERIDLWLERRKDRPLGLCGADAAKVPHDRVLSARLRALLVAQRRSKGPEEIASMRRAIDVTASGFARARGLAVEGLTERAMQIVVDATILQAGAEQLAFPTVVASGPNASFFHARPTDRHVASDELVVIDAGGECGHYAADVTRTIYIGSSPNGLARDLLATVDAAQMEGIQLCVVGREFRDIHAAIMGRLAEGLIDCGILRGRAEDLTASGCATLFCPHAVGHSIGLTLTDGTTSSVERRPVKGSPGLSTTLALDLPLCEGMVVCLEPGVYFNPFIVNSPSYRSQYKAQVRWERVDKLDLIAIGGVRTEDEVLITGVGPEVLTGAIDRNPLVS